MKTNCVSLLLAFASLALLPCAQADTVLFNALGTSAPFNTLRAAGSAPVGVVTFSTAITISAIGVYDAMSSAGTQTFLIGSFDTGQLLYQSAAKAFAGDGGTGINLDSYKVSDPFTFTFLPGVRYDIGATSSVSTGYYAAFDAATENGITVAAGNDNVNGTTFARTTACCSTGIELFAPSVAPVAVTPEPSSLLLLGTGLLGVVGTVRRRFV